MAEHASFVEQYLQKLSTINISDLPAGSECIICQDPYGTASDTNIQTEHAVRLECDHIVGSECISKWLLERGKNSCPYCRRELFPLLASESDDESDEELDEDMDEDSDDGMDEDSNEEAGSEPDDNEDESELEPLLTLIQSSLASPAEALRADHELRRLFTQRKTRLSTGRECSGHYFPHVHVRHGAWTKRCP